MESEESVEKRSEGREREDLKEMEKETILRKK